MDDYLGRRKAERTNMAKLREMRLAAQAKAAVKPEPKTARRRPVAKGTRS